MGAAFKTRQIWRTKKFTNSKMLHRALAIEIAKTKDEKDPATVETSFLAVPFLGPKNQPVLILYADCDEMNVFADNKRVEQVTAMGNGFCRLFDQLQKEPCLNLRNFPMQKGQPVKGKPTVYASVQEPIFGRVTPKI